MKPETSILARRAPLLLVGLAIGMNMAHAQGAVPTIERLTPGDCATMRERHAFQPDNPVSCQRLRRIDFAYHSRNGVRSDGRLVVLDVFAPSAARLLGQLFQQGFLIEKARPIENYDGSDELSMEDGNTSAFNSRRPATVSAWSLHAYGAAIDINPLQNPTVYPDQAEDAQGHIVPGPAGTALVRPAAAASRDDDYLNRALYRARADDDGFYRPGMAEAVVELFARNGFLTWGGYWNDPLDYQHFEVGPARLVQRIYRLDPADAPDPRRGRMLFEQYLAAYGRCAEEKKAQGAPDGYRVALCARETIKQFAGT